MPEPAAVAPSLRPLPGGSPHAANVAVELVTDAEAGGGWLEEARIERLVQGLVERELGSGAYSISLHLVDDAEIRRLNGELRGQDEVTDVLSFPLHDPGGLQDPHGMRFVTPPGQPVCLGDVVVSRPRMLRQAVEYGHSAERELAYLVAHGVLHVLGYDHEDEDERQVMRAREEEALAPLGLTRG